MDRIEGVTQGNKGCCRVVVVLRLNRQHLWFVSGPLGHDDERRRSLPLDVELHATDALERHVKRDAILVRDHNALGRHCEDAIQ